MALLANKNYRRIKVALCLIAIALSQLVVSMQGSGFSAAQTKSRKKPASQAQTQKPAAKPSATPTLLERLGEPPPPNPLPPKRKSKISPGDVISVETTEVMLPVTVRDANGRLVSQLTRDDFRVFEDDRQQPLRDLALRQVPVDAILMIDASSSAVRNLDDFRRAAEGFAKDLGPEDRISLIKFDDTVQLLQDWTSSRFQLQRALNRLTPGCSPVSTMPCCWRRVTNTAPPDHAAL